VSVPLVLLVANIPLRDQISEAVTTIPERLKISSNQSLRVQTVQVLGREAMKT